MYVLYVCTHMPPRMMFTVYFIQWEWVLWLLFSFARWSEFCSYWSFPAAIQKWFRIHPSNSEPSKTDQRTSFVRSFFLLAACFHTRLWIENETQWMKHFLKIELFCQISLRSWLRCPNWLCARLLKNKRENFEKIVSSKIMLQYVSKNTVLQHRLLFHVLAARTLLIPEALRTVRRNLLLNCTYTYSKSA